MVKDGRESVAGEMGVGGCSSRQRATVREGPKE